MVQFNDPNYSSQWQLGAGYGINIASLYGEYTGAGIRVGVVDTALSTANKDLANQIDTAAGRAAANQTSADDAISTHGTGVANILAAEANNGYGRVGAAYDVTLVSYSFDSVGYRTAAQEIEMMSYQYEVDVSNNSWSRSGSAFYDNFNTALYDGALEAVASAARLGRDGLGTIIVRSAGNLGASGDDVNTHNWANNRYSITVGATDENGAVQDFSNPGAAVLVVVPATATSYAAPLVSATAALMLEANPDLGYRDVQTILALSAKLTDASGSGWFTNAASGWNGGGLHVAREAGFGLLDAHAAVRLAESWTAQSTTANLIETSASATTAAAIEDNSSLSQSVHIGQDLLIERVEVAIDLAHNKIGDLRIVLVSPGGTESVLLDRVANGNYDAASNSLTFTLSSVQYLWESAQGDWRLIVEDAAGKNTGTLLGWTLNVIGSAPSDDTQLVLTDEYASLIAADATRAVLSDDGGQDTINGAALTSALSLNLAAGSTSRLKGQTFTIAAGSVIENAIGGDGNDSLLGNEADNQLTGNRGNDLLAGYAGNDTLSGGLGNDTLLGGLGEDTLLGGEGDDRLLGEAGNDALAGGDGADTLEGGDGNDTLQGEAGNDVLLGGAGLDTLTGGEGDDQLFGGSAADQLLGGAGDDALYGEAGNDTLAGGAGNDQLYGGDGADLLTGGEGADLLFGDAGVDTLEGGLGSDVLYGGDARDFLDGGEGEDRLFGEAGLDVLTGGAGNDLLDGGTEADTLSGGDGNDTLLGGDGNDTLFGEAGADTLSGGGGSDRLWGGDGDDLIDGGDAVDVISGGAGNDAIEGGAGNDTLSGEAGNDTIQGGAGADSILGGEGNDLLLGGADNDTIDGGDGNDTIDGGSGYNRLSGGNGEDIITGGASRDDIDGGAGNDTLSGGEGNDFITGGDGDDRLDGGLGADSLAGGAGDDVYLVNLGSDIVTEAKNQGTDTVLASASYVLGEWVENLTLTGAEAINGTGNNIANEIRGNEAANLLLGYGGTDLLDGGAGNDTLDGGIGADTLIGGLGDDVLTGGSAADVFLLRLGDGSDRITDFRLAQGDTVLLQGFGSAIDSWAEVLQHLTQTSAGVLFDSGLGTSLLFEGLKLTGLSTTSFAFAGSDGAQAAAPLVLQGGAGDDTLLGGARADTLDGGAGNDTLDGGLGADTMTGGAGHDVYVVDDAGDLVIEAKAQGLDTVRAGIDYTLGDWVENLTLLGTGHLTGTGNNLSNDILGNAGDNVLTGQGGTDLLDGGAGNDTLDGGIGADTLIGGSGNDVLIGGSAGDIFLFRADEGSDRITDFRLAQGDVVLLQGFGAALDSWAEVAAHLSQTSAGAVLETGLGTSILFEGVKVSQLGEAAFAFG